MASQKNIIKRDGRIEPFNKQKVVNAVKKAFVAVDGTLTKAGVKKARRIGKEIETIAFKSKVALGVEEVQDMVEELLMATDRKDVARAYILYRQDRNIERNRKTNLMQNVAEKLFASNVQNQKVCNYAIFVFDRNVRFFNIRRRVCGFYCFSFRIYYF